MTNLDNVELAVRLADLAAEPAPPPAFDPHTAVATGRTRLRRRRRAVATAVATATVAAVTAALLLVPGGGGSSSLRLVPAAPPRGEQGVAVPKPVRTAVGTPTDPLVSGGTFGWLPDGLDPVRDVSYEAGQDAVVTRASQPVSNGLNLALIVHSTGAEPPLVDTAQQKQVKVPAPPVNGRTAYWVTDPTHPTFDRQRILRWLTASGRWAQLVSSPPKDAGVPDDALLRVAAEAVVDEQPVPMPFWFSGLPTGTRVTGAAVTRPANGQPWIASADLWLDGKTLGVFVLPDDNRRYGKTDTRCRREQGLQICATAESDDLPLAPQLGDLDAVTNLMHVTGPDEKTWTTRVIR
ncbi:hypothetical protein ABTZ03_39005 [Kitasatospora sp. NPDC096077]|uniref:hypothetical protein n=1 Tax=Kitasatospora sp. NPDC096077 TaxID=3155544 RepID=UPI00332A90FB